MPYCRGLQISSFLSYVVCDGKYIDLKNIVIMNHLFSNTNLCLLCDVLKILQRIVPDSLPDDIPDIIDVLIGLVNVSTVRWEYVYHE